MLGYVRSFALPVANSLSAAFQAIYTDDRIEYDNSHNEAQLNDFWICNARVNQKLPLFNKVKTDLFIEIRNIFDQNYEEENGPGPGRSFLAGMTLGF